MVNDENIYDFNIVLFKSQKAIKVKICTLYVPLW